MPDFSSNLQTDSDDAFAAWAAEPLHPLEPLAPPYAASGRSWASEWIPESMRSQLEAEEHELRVYRPTPRA